MLSQAQRQKLRPKLVGLPAGENARFWARADPVEFLRLNGEEPWKAQADILEQLWANREVDVYSAHAIGKTWLAARAAMTWVRAWFPDVLVVILAPTEDQLVAGLWREIHQAWERWPPIMPGMPGLRSWSVEGYGVVALGRSPRPERPGTLQGLHSQNLLLIIDEAAEIDERLWAAARSLLTGANTRLLAIGNPTQDTGEFFRRSTGRTVPGQVAVKVSAFDTPNLRGIDPDSPTLRDDLIQRMTEPASHPGLVDARYVLGVLDEGLDREWKTRVLAEFPEGGDDVLIPRSWIERARRDDRERRVRVEGSKLQAGVDIARMGSDRSVLFARMGGVVFEPVVWGQVDLMVSAGKLAAWMRDNAPEVMYVDEGGMGIGVVDRLTEQGFPVRPFKHNEAPRNAIKFDDRRSEYWHELRAVFERDEIDLSQLSEESFRTLAEELAAPRYSFTSAGKIKIEPKIKTKDRLKRSPDLADALVYCTWGEQRPVYVGTW
jgi:phage terminase large subunit